MGGFVVPPRLVCNLLVAIRAPEGAIGVGVMVVVDVPGDEEDFPDDVDVEEEVVDEG